MTDTLANLPPPRSTSQTQTAAQPSTRDAPSIVSDYQTFLKMLTTQIRNQDPLNPMEPSEFATQLATFSAVEQQVRANEQLANLNAAMLRMELGDSARWVGMQAQGDMAVHFTGDPITMDIAPPDNAAQVSLIVQNGAGQTVQTLPIDPRQTRLVWNGQTETGTPLPEGNYRFSIQSTINGQSTPRIDPAMPFATVRESRVNGSDVVLVMSGGIEIAAKEISALRSPPAQP